MTDVPRSQRVRFGSFEVDLITGELWKSRRKLRITAQQFSVLAILLERPSEVIGREELQKRLWPDTFVDVDHSLNGAINRIREILGDSVEKPRFVETLSRRGYRFIAQVEIVTDKPNPPPISQSPGKQSKSSATAPGEESFWIAVLPFKVSGSEKSVSDLALGLAEDIITGLSRFSYLRVISLKSTAQFSDKAVDVRSAGKKLGARYVLDGSVRLAGSLARVTAQLVDCASGANLWAESYRVSFRPKATFDVLDGIVPKIVSTIADTHGVLPRIMSEALRSKDVMKLSPYEAVIRSFAHFQRVSAEEHAAARTALECAVQRAPAYPDAWAMLALIYKEEFTHRFNLLPDPLGRAFAAAQRALEAAPSNHLAHHALASVEFFRGERQAFQIAAARAVELNPMDGFTLAYLGFLTAYAGDWEGGGAMSAKARGLNPHHPGWYWFVPCFDAYRKADYQLSLDIARRVNMPGFWRAQLALAANCGQRGEQPAACNALKTLLAQRPDIAKHPREELAIWWQPELVEHLIVGLRKAGLEM